LSIAAVELPDSMVLAMLFVAVQQVVSLSFLQSKIIQAPAQEQAFECFLAFLPISFSRFHFS
jgi:hypothetical protein